MALLVITLAVVATVAVGIAIRLARRARRAVEGTARPQLTPADPLRQEALPGGDPFDIASGYAVDTGDGDLLVVRGTASFQQGRSKWWEHYLAAGTRIHPADKTRRWLSVEEDEGEVEVVLWTAVWNTGLTPGAGTIIYQDVVYELEEHGTAHYTTTGTTDLPPSGTTQYFDYVGPRGKSLSFEQFDGDRDWEVSLGERVPSTLLIVYPPSSATS